MRTDLKAMSNHASSSIVSITRWLLVSGGLEEEGFENSSALSINIRGEYIPTNYLTFTIIYIVNK